jgi:predicted membrane chloride channel (bestrophin family)
MYCIQVLSHLFAASKLPHQLIVSLDENVSKLVMAVYGCERILNTPIPLSYTR